MITWNHVSIRLVKSILLDVQYWYYLTHRFEMSDFIPFSKAISLKVNVIVRLEFELAFNDVAVQYVSHYVTGTPPCIRKKYMISYYCKQKLNLCEENWKKSIETDCEVQCVLSSVKYYMIY